jgi:hypothetical protein
MCYGRFSIRMSYKDVLHEGEYFLFLPLMGSFICLLA